MIPPILHSSGSADHCRRVHKNTCGRGAKTNPNFTIICWNESNIDFTQPIIREAYARRQWAKVADIARLQAVMEHGGIYLDTDIHC